MKNFTEEQIAQMYDNLPEDLKEAIFGLEMNEIVEKIGRENQLNIEQIGDLANETGMVMLGVTHPNEFIGNLADRLEVDKEKARAIAQEINEQIFKEIEKDHSQENLVPDIMKGNANPFEEKMKEGVLIAPVEEKHYIEESAKTALLPEPEKPKKYQGFDPYKEPIE